MRFDFFLKLFSTFNWINDAVAQAINWYWITFAINGYPGNGTSQNPQYWSEFSLPNEDTMFFQQNQWQIIKNSGDNACKFWNNVGYSWLRDSNSSPGDHNNGDSDSGSSDHKRMFFFTKFEL